MTGRVLLRCLRAWLLTNAVILSEGRWARAPQSNDLRLNGCADSRAGDSRWETQGSGCADLTFQGEIPRLRSTRLPRRSSAQDDGVFLTTAALRAAVIDPLPPALLRRRAPPLRHDSYRSVSRWTCGASFAMNSSSTIDPSPARPRPNLCRPAVISALTMIIAQRCT